MSETEGIEALETIELPSSDEILDVPICVLDNVKEELETGAVVDLVVASKEELELLVVTLEEETRVVGQEELETGAVVDLVVDLVVPSKEELELLVVTLEEETRVVSRTDDEEPVRKIELLVAEEPSVIELVCVLEEEMETCFDV
jgi:hypothetical protein